MSNIDRIRSALKGKFTEDGVHITTRGDTIHVSHVGFPIFYVKVRTTPRATKAYFSELKLEIVNDAGQWPDGTAADNTWEGRGWIEHLVEGLHKMFVAGDFGCVP